MFKQTLHHCPVVFLSKDKVFEAKFVFMRYQRFLRASNFVKVFFHKMFQPPVIDQLQNVCFLLHFFFVKMFFCDDVF